MTPIANPVQALRKVLVKPNPVFHALSSINNWSWLPFIVVNAIVMFAINLYFNHIDLNWYIDTVIQQSMGDISPAEQAQFRELMNVDMLGGLSTIGVVFRAVIVNAILALYLHSMTKNDESHSQGFTDWYGAAWWTQMPLIISGLISIVLISVSSSTEILPSYMAPLSLGFLFGVDFNSVWFAFMISLRLDTIWTIYLLTACISQWTSLDSRKCLIIAGAPYALIFGGWFLFLLF